MTLICGLRILYIFQFPVSVFPSHRLPFHSGRQGSCGGILPRFDILFHLKDKVLFLFVENGKALRNFLSPVCNQSTADMLLPLLLLIHLVFLFLYNPLHTFDFPTDSSLIYLTRWNHIQKQQPEQSPQIHSAPQLHLYLIHDLPYDEYFHLV